MKLRAASAMAGAMSLLLAACGSTAAPAVAPSAGATAPVVAQGSLDGSPSPAAGASAAAGASVAASASTAAKPNAAASTSAAANASAASGASASGEAAGWKRPLDVKPLPEAGIFKIVSETPSPGDKVPVFFMGAQP